VIEGLDRVEVVTLFVDDLAATTAFYRDVLGLGTVFADDDSTVFALENLMINLLRSTQAPTLVEPARVAAGGSGARALFTIRVADVDAVCAELARQGVALLNGPQDRPWGRRTAAFADPAGHVWEVAQLLPAHD
jgi:lactoylglutathione lyase